MRSPPIVCRQDYCRLDRPHLPRCMHPSGGKSVLPCLGRVGTALPCLRLVGTILGRPHFLELVGPTLRPPDIDCSSGGQDPNWRRPSHPSTLALRCGQSFGPQGLQPHHSSWARAGAAQFQ